MFQKTHMHRVVCAECGGEQFTPIWELGAFKEKDSKDFNCYICPVDGERRHIRYVTKLKCNACGAMGSKEDAKLTYGSQITG